MVCETVAPGLGTLGLVIWADVNKKEVRISTMADSLSIDFSFGMKFLSILIYDLHRPQHMNYTQVVITTVER